MSSLLAAGTVAPDFSLPDQNGEIHSLADYRGRYTLVYFYPKDDTPGCTKEACAIRDAWPEFEKIGATVLGISTDPVASHKKFEAKYELPFTLLSDASREVVNVYGVWGIKKFMGRTYEGTHRVSFLVNPEGVIQKVYDPVKPELHADEVLTDIRQFSA